jgi:hypothetical protein
VKGIAWSTPTGWSPEQAGQFQDAVWSVAGGLSCALSVYPGDGGGLVPNLQRWARQVGAPPPDAGALPKLPMLGGEAWYLDLSAGAGDGMLAVYAPVDGQTVFVKLTGERAALRAQRPQFEAFCRGLRRQ